MRGKERQRQVLLNIAGLLLAVMRRISSVLLLIFKRNLEGKKKRKKRKINK